MHGVFGHMGWTSYHAHNDFSCKGVQRSCLQLPLTFVTPQVWNTGLCAKYSVLIALMSLVMLGSWEKSDRCTPHLD